MVVDLTGIASSANPAVSKSGGAVQVRWLVTWDAPVPFFIPRKIWATIVNYDGTLGPSTIVDPGSTPGDQTDADSDTLDGTTFLVAWEEVEAATTDRDVRCRELEVIGATLQGSPSVTTVAGVPAVDEADPAVGSTGEAWVVAWRKESTGGPLANYDIAARTLQDPCCTPCESETVVSSLASNEQRLELATQFSAGLSAGDEALLAWDATSTITLSTSVLARRYRTDIGSVENLGGGCGGLSTAISCAGLGANLAHNLVNASPISIAILVIGFGNLASLPCGSCTIGPDPFSSFLFPTTVNSLGSATIFTPIPPDPVLAGLQFLEQWANVASPAGCAALGVNLTPALRVTIGV